MTEQKKSRGRPRNTAARENILEAARQLLDEAGPARLTIEAVATRAKVGKPTIYRYWSNARELAMAALMARMPDASSIPQSSSAVEDLRVHVRGLIARFATTRGRQTAVMLATAERDSEMFKAFRNQVVMAGRDEGRAILERAQSQGEISISLDIDSALDLIYGPVFFRLLTVHAPLSQTFADEIVRMVLEGIRHRSSDR